MNNFTRETIMQLLLKWYTGFDEHAPISSYQDLLVSQDLFIDLPPRPSTSFRDFSDWYLANNQKFFDGKHTLKDIQIDLGENQAQVVIDMNWTVRTWTPPEAKSLQLNLDMISYITIEKDAITGKPKIKNYQAVDK